MNDQLDEKLLKSLKVSIRNNNHKFSAAIPNTIRPSPFNRKNLASETSGNKEIEFMEKHITVDDNNNSSLIGKTPLETQLPNRNIEKDVKRILISILIHLLVKIFNKKYYVISVCSYLLVLVNIVYLVAKVVILIRNDNIISKTNNDINNNNMLKTIELINTYKNNNQFPSSFDISSEDTLAKKTFFDNIQDTPLRQRRKSATLVLSKTKNSVESSYIPSSKFNYKLSDA